MTFTVLLLLISVIFSFYETAVSGQDFGKICKLPSLKGNCMDMTVDMWYHNQESGKCEQFQFSGCNGNANRFSTQADCEHLCSVGRRKRDNQLIESAKTRVPISTTQRPDCSAGKQSGSLCPSNSTSDVLYRWYWNFDKFECMSFRYNGCDGNSNNFLSHQECVSNCQPMDGPACLGGSDNSTSELIGNTCQQLTCPETHICKMGAFFASCCSKTQENEAICPDGTPILRHVQGNFILADNCDDLQCPTGYSCVKGNVFSRCCSITKYVKPTLGPF